MSPALNGSSPIRRFEGSDAIEIRNGIIFDFYTELPHMYGYHLTSLHPCLSSLRRRLAVILQRRSDTVDLCSLGH